MPNRKGHKTGPLRAVVDRRYDASPKTDFRVPVKIEFEVLECGHRLDASGLKPHLPYRHCKQCTTPGRDHRPQFRQRV